MQQMIWAVLISFLAVMVMAPIGIPLLKKLKYGQTIYELGPQSHLAKQGVPTMGGVMIAIAVTIVGLVLTAPREAVTAYRQRLETALGVLCEQN